MPKLSQISKGVTKSRVHARAWWFSSAWERREGVWLWAITAGIDEQSTRPTALWLQTLQKPELFQLTMLFRSYSYHKIDLLTISSKVTLPISEH